MSRSHTVVAGSRLELHCRVSSWPLPRVTWRRQGSPLNFTTDPRLSLQPGVAMAPRDVAVDNATLVIADVTYDDRDVYVCDVTSYVNGSWHSANSTVLVRVKGQMSSPCVCIYLSHSDDDSVLQGERPRDALSTAAQMCENHHTTPHNRFTALFPGPPG